MIDSTDHDRLGRRRHQDPAAHGQAVQPVPRTGRRQRQLTLRRIEVSGGYLRGILDGGGAGVRVRNGSLTLDQVVIRDNE